jgi:hypothetical protein
MDGRQESYEHILDVISGLPGAQSANDRTIRWLEGQSQVGVARSPEGRIEIFLAGHKIQSKSRVLQESLEHQTWHREAGAEFLANRLLLPAAGYFDQVAAFLCTELLRNGAADDVQAAFSRTEPVLELAIQRLRLADQAVLGLIGELLVLDGLVREAADDRVVALLDAWRGYQPSLRDFDVERVGVEVKTTSRATSSHQIQGVHQVERGGPADAEERALKLVSVGLQWLEFGEEGEAGSLPQLVDSILGRVLDATQDSAAARLASVRFLARVEEYGAASEIGYDHKTMSTHATYQRAFGIRFVRCYDMDDPAVQRQVLRTDDVRHRPYTDLASVRFRINLPERVDGDVNPVVGLSATAQAILELALGSS